MFNLDNVTGKLNSAHVSPEFNGDEPVPAQYLSISVDVPNTLLNQLDPELLPMFYKQADQKTIDGSLTSLRSKTVQPDQKIKYEGMGYKLDIEHGIDEESAIHLTGCKVDKIVCTMCDGGTVKMGLRVSTKCDEITSGILDHMQQQEITFTLTPPTAAELKELAEKNKPRQQEMSA